MIRKLRDKSFYGTFLSFLILNQIILIRSEESCYDNLGLPKRCSPDFINVAYERPVFATNTCGERKSQFCLQSSHQQDYSMNRFEKCDICSNEDTDKSHPTQYLTDNNKFLTWWQTETMEHGIQYPNSVNLTLNFGKQFDITYVQIKFYSSRPESFVIYKKANKTDDWMPYQYYSSNCLAMYNIPASQVVRKDDEAIALCSEEHSDITPLTGASIVFSTLEERPNAYKFEETPSLKEWVTATDIMISLNRLNTFGDEIFDDTKVLQSYFYAISDISIGARCKCNGHASMCTAADGLNYKCECQHNTDGDDCEKCLPYFNDLPWSPATLTDAHECKPCDCQGKSDECIFNSTLYALTGHGGQCINCRDNTEGEHCQDCQFGFYRSEDNNECIDCQCNKLGSLSEQCDPSGKCECKPGVTGLKCNQCLPYHYGLSFTGCKKCECNEAGSSEPLTCDPRDGKCRCKPNVDGINCDKCKPGHFYLDAKLKAGCLPCNCNGHTSDCTSADNYVKSAILSNFTVESESDWSMIDAKGNTDSIVRDSKFNGLFILADHRDRLWFKLPKKYLGNQLKSYSQNLNIEFLYTIFEPFYDPYDIIIENEVDNLKIYASFYDLLDKSKTDQVNPVSQKISLKLIETSNWRPELSASNFQRLLSNISSINIKAARNGYTFLTSLSLDSAQHVSSEALTQIDANNKALWIEKCTCPSGYTGEFCQTCDTGFTREIQNGISFVRCVECACNNHSSQCDPQTGKCDCAHQTTGHSCESCKEGFYGNALIGSAQDCKKCPCPEEGPCEEVFNYQSNAVDVVCTHCPIGTTGNLCDSCDDGFYLVSTNELGEIQCKECVCSSNIDLNSIGNCDQKTGNCLNCLYNTTGDNCEKCLPSYWGNATTLQKCSACECFANGSLSEECDLTNGQCTCKNNVIGRQCDRCKDTYWNINLEEGCIECKCNLLGSLDLSCDQQTGKCKCRPGVTGDKCDQCMPNHYGFSSEGCTPCNCSPLGSVSAQCDYFGRCKCKNERVKGEKCDQCSMNHFNFTSGCKKCDECFDLVKEKFDELNGNLIDLETALPQIIQEKHTSEKKAQNKEFEKRFDQIKSEINKIHEGLLQNITNHSSYDKAVDSYKKRVKELELEHKSVDDLLDKVNQLNILNTKLGVTIQELQLLPPVISRLQYDLDLAKQNYEEENQADDSRVNVMLNEAKQTAKEQRNKANDFSKMVNKYINEGRNAIGYLLELNKKYAHLNKQLVFEKEVYEAFEQQSESLQDQANKLKTDLDASIENINKQLEILTKQEFNDSDYVKDSEKFINKVDEINNQIQNYSKQIERADNQLDKFVKKSAEKTLKAKNLIKTLEVKNQDMDYLLRKSQESKNATDDAVKSINDSFEKAKKTLETLENFDEVLKTNKEKAREALTLEPEINANLKELEKKLDDTNKLTNKLNNKVQQASNMNQRVDEKLNEKDVQESKAKATKLNADSKDLYKKVLENIESNKKNLDSANDTLEMYNNLPNKLSDLLLKSQDIANKTHDLLNHVFDSQDLLNKVEKTKLVLTEITSEQYEALRKNFEQVEREIDQMIETDAIINDFEEAQKKLDKELTLRKRQVSTLSRELEALGKVRNQLYAVENVNCQAKRKIKMA